MKHIPIDWEDCLNHIDNCRRCTVDWNRDIIILQDMYQWAANSQTNKSTDESTGNLLRYKDF